jgi:hypothetical protein
MDIYEYLEATKNILSPDEIIDENSDLYRHFREIAHLFLQSRVNIVPIYTSSVFPEIVHLLWDCKFWEYYDSYLLGVAYFKQKGRTHIRDVQILEYRSV